MIDLCEVRMEIKWIRAEYGEMIKLEVVVPLAWSIKPLRFTWQGVLDGSSPRLEYRTSM